MAGNGMDLLYTSGSPSVVPRLTALALASLLGTLLEVQTPGPRPWPTNSQIRTRQICFNKLSR